ncbi:hypothetical protein GFS24_25055 [Chitinophaga sp. SYP-B3965]|uniref:hypothetical protein n=1 Tax=Chitinophaga sp. SYP-B3965 TaxID=2663120 RepID=UPI001299676A|nr:hypothetical protein [Chitinophaga sp. SYP-B3965]MRG48408.1 hypothetical protein [Chitinophaga sp. SYP-B3965]
MSIPNKIPPFRRLRGYAFDPSLSLRGDTAFINNIVYNVPWESNLKPGPIGEYVEIIDFDPTTGRHYVPLNLNDVNLLAQDGLEPSESNPQFHQQMTYAVVMTTISNFETALGRKVLWAPRRLEDRGKYADYVPRLRIYPHALREANAYYSPQKKGLLFGYFEARPANSTLHMPNSFVFTCLSHDIIAHEVTHAILDGLHPSYSEASNADVLAFHEAFADIVALFQHFTFPEVLKHQIAKTRGDLGAQNLLGELAQEFGSAIGGYGSLRDAIGKIDPVTKQWKATEPSGEEYGNIMEPHQRGSILVSAVFEAFITIYKNRIKDLLRMATGGTGVLPQGELHPDLVNRLSTEAAKAAKHVLNMCIRALDYCPPVDITFGDYLRAIITADSALMKNDVRDYRLAFIDAFRRRGIYPQGLKTFSVESLALNHHTPLSPDTSKLMEILADFLKEYRNNIMYESDRQKIYEESKKYITGRKDENIQGLHERINIKFEDNKEFQQLTGLVFNSNWEELGIRTSAKTYKDGAIGPSFQIQNLRVVSRVGPDGNLVNQIVFSLVQRSAVEMENGAFKRHFDPAGTEELKSSQFFLFGGCTMVFDLDTMALKHIVSKPLLDTAKLKKGMPPEIDKDRIERQYRYQQEEGVMHLSEHSLYFGSGLQNKMNEPFSFLHH